MFCCLVSAHELLAASSLPGGITKYVYPPQVTLWDIQPASRLKKRSLMKIKDDINPFYLLFIIIIKLIQKFSVRWLSARTFRFLAAARCCRSSSTRRKLLLVKDTPTDALLRVSSGGGFCFCFFYCCDCLLTFLSSEVNVGLFFVFQNLLHSFHLSL